MGDEMKNPWEEISLSDYEKHMELDSVRQLQALNEMMKGQFESYPVACVMILGVAGGNGLAHISKMKFRKVYGIDVNAAYLKETVRRYAYLGGLLECICMDLTEEAEKLPEAEMIVANLLIEYIGCACFQKVVRHVRPRYVSCIIQINTEDGWVSDSPYLHVFDGLERVHHLMDEKALEQAMREIEYRKKERSEHILPNGKKLVRMDFVRESVQNTGEGT